MEEEDRKAVTKALDYICTNLTNVDRILGILRAKGTITGVQEDEINAERYSYGRNKTLVDSLLRREGALIPFIDALEETNQPHIIQKIKSNYEQAGNEGNSASARQGNRSAGGSANFAAGRDYKKLQEERLPQEVRNVIRENLPELKTEINDPWSVIQYMTVTYALNDARVARLNALRANNHDVINELMTMLQQSSVYVFVRFLEALDDSDQRQVKSLLRPILGKTFQLTSTSIIF